ncbi:dipeptide/oligopeptide/nickel ABC transporter permease/ATP-binding protein [Rhodococcus opacus]|uniref:dipeptide/oligopeptide/nickel ABC transporter permease/ATP-binding protein n=1 Tax=Rhodococcus opacus TaxID=37919 RepID=UPI001C4423E5|nr:dipeptide/oligopeptide/nickel ABC transporter permease/ATP-binding protein [Rhodococcus opacus]MBV6756255.1 dipeptide/oligopeptide/nickel ABC transporter permease/ATP-binding protein [Rhodococcus opacus]
MTNTVDKVADAAPTTPANPESGGRSRTRFVSRLLGQHSTVFWAGLVLLIAVAAVAAPLLTSYSPTTGVMSQSMMPPSAQHWLGTDRFGRDVFCRVLFGGRVALIAAIEAVVIAMIVGIPFGLIIGYIGGWTDRIVMRVVDGVMSVPFLVLAIALIAAFGPGLYKSMAIVGVVYAMILLRLTRGEVLSAKEELFVEGMKVSGAGNGRLLLRHILPNIAPPLIVQVTLMFATAIIAEATLSYLGLGVQQPTPSWGSMLADAQSSIRQNFFLVIPPGLAIFLTVLAINQVGDGLRDLFAREIKQGSLGLNNVHRKEGDPTTSQLEETGSANVLEVSDLTVSFPQPGAGTVEVVQNVSLTLGRGEILGLVGESGSGKSVTAMSMLGLVPYPGRIEATSITLDRREISGLSFNELRTIRGGEIGVVFQDPLASLNPAYTVGDQVSEVLREHLALDETTARAKVVELFTRVGIAAPETRLGDYPHQFSGGMAQRVMIAMALACEPKVLVADEPTTALDVTVQRQILRLLVELRDAYGLSIVLITHDLGVIAETADRVAVMYAGQLVEIGSVEDVFGQPAHPYTEGLLQSIPRNVARQGRLPSIPGVVPQPADWPKSCHFADRCAHATEVCRARPVPLQLHRLDETRQVRCVRADVLALSGVTESSAEILRT